MEKERRLKKKKKRRKKEGIKWKKKEEGEARSLALILKNGGPPWLAYFVWEDPRKKID